MNHPLSAELSESCSGSASAALYERALKVLPGGCSRNAVFRKPHPLYAAYGQGCYVTDVEGVRRIDFSNNMGSLIHGHACPAVIQAVEKQLRLGTAYMMATEAEVEYAEYLCGRVPGFDKIRFVNSGTEAVMLALKAARAYTGRSMIAKVEGAYHGLYDYAEVSEAAQPSDWGDIDRPARVPVARGTPSSALDEVVVIPFNDIERTTALLDRHASKLAAVLIDLMPHRAGLMPADQDFVRAVWEWTRKHRVLFVCDEVITFRTTFTGAQENYGLRPDLTALGKMIGGGFPVGAVAGRNDVMSVLDPLAKAVLVPHSGTFNANPVTMVAGRTAMERFDQDAVTRLNRLGELARSRIREAIASSGAPACVTGSGSLFRIHFKPHPPRNHRDAFATPAEQSARKAFVQQLLDRRILLVETCSGMLSTAMTDREIDALADGVRSAFKAIY